MVVANWSTINAASQVVGGVGVLSRDLCLSRSCFHLENNSMPRPSAPHLLPISSTPNGRASASTEHPGAGQYQEASERLQKLQPAGTTTAEIANELNNLLAVIIGNAELLKEVPDSPKLTRYMSDYILNAAERGADLAQRLQVLSRH